VEEDDADLLVELVNAGLLKEELIDSRDLVNKDRKTLKEVALACNNRRAINFFNNNLRCGPSFFTNIPTRNSQRDTYLSSLGSDQLIDAPPTPAHGLGDKMALLAQEGFAAFDAVSGKTAPSISAASVELSYPSIPSAMKLGHSVKFEAVLEQAGADKALISGQKTFFTEQDLPAGMRIDSENGTIFGVPEEESDCEVVIVAQLGEPRYGQSRYEVTCIVHLHALSPPRGLFYPKVQTTVDLTVGTEPKGLGVVSPQGAAHRAAKGLAMTKEQQLRIEAAVKFEAAPVSSGGAIQQYEIVPALPKGMTMDLHMGSISGVPEHGFPMVLTKTYDVFGYNAVGMSGCQIELEVLGGKFGLASLRVHSLDPSDPSTVLQDSYQASRSWDQVDEDHGHSRSTSKAFWEDTTLHESREYGVQEDAVSDASHLAKEDAEAADSPREPPATAPWLHRTFPAIPTNAVDWDQLVPKVAIILEKFGTPMMMEGGQLLGLAPGKRAVKGMETSAVLQHLGLTVDLHYARRLIRLVEQNLSICSRESPAFTRSDPRGLICVADEKANQPGAVVLYLLKPVLELQGKAGIAERACPYLPPAPRIPPPAPPTAMEVLKMEEAVSAVASEVNAEFSKLIPYWRQRMESTAPKARIEAMKRWRTFARA